MPIPPAQIRRNRRRARVRQSASLDLRDAKYFTLEELQEAVRNKLGRRIDQVRALYAKGEK